MHLYAGNHNMVDVQGSMKRKVDCVDRRLVCGTHGLQSSFDGRIVSLIGFLGLCAY